MEVSLLLQENIDFQSKFNSEGNSKLIMEIYLFNLNALFVILPKIMETIIHVKYIKHSGESSTFSLRSIRYIAVYAPHYR